MTTIEQNDFSQAHRMAMPFPTAWLNHAGRVTLPPPLCLYSCDEQTGARTGNTRFAIVHGITQFGLRAAK